MLTELPRYREQSRPFLAFLYDITAGVVNGADALPDHPLDRLPAAQRDVVILRTVVGLSAEETAEAVSMSPSGVRLAQHRALEALRETMGRRSGAG